MVFRGMQVDATNSAGETALAYARSRRLIPEQLAALEAAMTAIPAGGIPPLDPPPEIQPPPAPPAPVAAAAAAAALVAPPAAPAQPSLPAGLGAGTA